MLFSKPNIFSKINVFPRVKVIETLKGSLNCFKMKVHGKSRFLITSNCYECPNNAPKNHYGNLKQGILLNFHVLMWSYTQNCLSAPIMGLCVTLNHVFILLRKSYTLKKYLDLALKNNKSVKVKRRKKNETWRFGFTSL